MDNDLDFLDFLKWITTRFSEMDNDLDFLKWITDFLKWITT